MANLGIDSSFWRGRRVLLTGHTGFKGGWLSLWLSELGAEVFGYALDPLADRSFFEQAGIASVINDVRGDIRNLDSLTGAMRAARPSIVFHLAAQSLVRESYRDPIGTLSTNVMGTANVCEAVRMVNHESVTSPVRAVLVVTTDKCYENHEWHWGYREIDRLGGNDLYSSSKACAELVLCAYRASFAGRNNMPIAMATARAGNVIGGGDWSTDRLVPDAIRAFEVGQSVLIRNPHAVRPWQHVLDPLAGYLLLAQRLINNGSEFSEAWNFGPTSDADVSVSNIISNLARLWGDGAAWSSDTSDKHPPEANYLKLDSSKARARLLWRPQLTLQQALDFTVAWYLKRNESPAALRDMTLAQIRSYSMLTVAA